MTDVKFVVDDQNHQKLETINFWRQIKSNQIYFIGTIKHNKNIYMTQQTLEVLIGQVTESELKVKT